MVRIEYLVPEQNIAAFLEAMRPVRDERLRDGAVSWSLYRDLAEGQRFVEQFVVESWLEHLRQHERVSRHDADAQNRVRELTVDPTVAPVVTHALAVGVCQPASTLTVAPD